jgi:hypothetical protein
MKKTILFLAIAAIVASCEPNEPKAFSIKDTDMISIRPAASAANAPQKVKADDAHLSALEIVKQAHHFRSNYNGFTAEYSFSDKDTISESPKLMFWAQYVISIDGSASLQEDVIASTDLVLIKQSGSYPNYINDTIAYIPNSVLRAAETAIRKAYADKDIDECFRLFDSAYTFTPITGAEWRALKANGQN